MSAGAGSGHVADPGSGRLGKRFKVFMAGYLLSCVGSGLILPFTAIYVDSHLRLGSGYVAIFFGVLACTSLIAGLVGGRLVDRFGPRGPGSLGASCIGAGYLILAVADSRWHVPVSATVVGVGTGLFHPAFTPAAARLTPAPLHRRAFALRHLVMNFGLGVGAALAVLLSPEAETFRLLFVLNAVSYAPLAAALWVAGGPTKVERRAPGPGRTRGYRQVLSSGPLRLLCTTQLLISLFGFAQLGVSVPLLLHGSMGETLRVVGAVVVVNTVAVVVLQYPLARLFEFLTEGFTLALTGLIWIVAYGSGALASMSSGTARTVLIFAFPVLFAAGEAAYSSSFFSLLTRLSPDDALGKTSAVAAQAFSLGSIAGPAIGVLVVTGLGATASWSCLVVAAALPLASAMMLMSSLRRADMAFPQPAPPGR